jgi:hypothetical protein
MRHDIVVALVAKRERLNAEVFYEFDEWNRMKTSDSYIENVMLPVDRVLARMSEAFLNEVTRQLDE